MLSCQRPPKRRREAIKKYGPREVFDLKTKEGLRMYRSNLYEMEVRQGFQCAICQRIAGSMMQFDHQDGRGSNGGHRDDRIVDEEGDWINAALCANCNSLKGSKRYHWLNGKYVEKFKETENVEA